MTQLTIEQAFQIAIQHHQAGRLSQAEAIYRQILTQHPDQPDALHLLGVIAQQVGRHDAAVELIQRAVTLNPSFPEAHNNLGISLRGSGQLDAAIAAFRQAIALNPKYSEAYYHLGIGLQDKGQLDNAIMAYRQAIALKPSYAEAYYNLGIALQEKGQLDDAINSYRQAIALRPDYSEAHSNLGVVLAKAGQFDAAIAACRQALAANPNYPEAHSNLGNVLRDNRQLDEAIAAFRQAIALNLSYPDAYYNLGNTLKEKGQPEAAIAAYRAAIAIQPGYAEAHYNVGVVLMDMDQSDAAIAAFQQAIALKHNYPEAYVNIGNVLKNKGQLDEAVICYQRALAIDRNMAVAYRSLSAVTRSKSDMDEPVLRLKELLADPDLIGTDRVAAGFALGKWHDDAQQYDEAFEYYVNANRLHRELKAAAGVRYDGHEFARKTDRLIASTPASFFRGIEGHGADDGARSGSGTNGSTSYGAQNDSELPVFIVGMPRSGTSLVEQIAASHRDVFGAGELTDIGRLVSSLEHPRLGDAAFSDDTISTTVSGGDPAGTHFAYLRSLSSSAVRVIDKLPDNVFHLSYIARWFPKARVIFCTRDPRDTCLSCYFQRFNEGHLYSYDLHDCGTQYANVWRLMKHWRNVLPLQMLEMNYESLVADLEGQSRRLIDFLGLEWDPACLNFEKTQRTVKTASAWQVRQPLYSRSVGRWRHYERHLGALFAVLSADQDWRLG